MVSERKFISENLKRVLVKEYIKREGDRTGFGGLEIQRTPLGTRLTLIAERPGFIIGKGGRRIKDLTEKIEKEFKIDNPQIEVQEVKSPNLNPQVIAKKLADALERGWHFRRAGHSAVRRIMGAGAKGCQVTISGKLRSQRHRRAKFAAGHIKYCGEPSKIWMLEGQASALTKTGVLGVKVMIMDPNARLPDEVNLISEKGEVEKEKKVKEKKGKKKPREKKREEKGKGKAEEKKKTSKKVSERKQKVKKEENVKGKR